MSSIVCGFQLTLARRGGDEEEVKGQTSRDNVKVKWRPLRICHELVAPLVDMSCTGGAPHGQVTN